MCPDRHTARVVNRRPKPCCWLDHERLIAVAVPSSSCPTRTSPFVMQGILSPLDAMDAVRAGADGVIVSNHGGRALDGALSSIESLGPVVKVCCRASLGASLGELDSENEVENLCAQSNTRTPGDDLRPLGTPSSPDHVTHQARSTRTPPPLRISRRYALYHKAPASQCYSTPGCEEALTYSRHSL